MKKKFIWTSLKVIFMPLRPPFFSFLCPFFTFAVFCAVFCSFWSFSAKAQDCQGRVRRDLDIRPFGSQGDIYHYKKGEIISDVRAHRASFFGKPSYYLSRGIGPLPAKAIELLNCHAVTHPSEGFFDPGYDLIPNEWDKKSEEVLNYQKPVPVHK